MTDQSKYAIPVGQNVSVQLPKPNYTFALHSDTGAVGKLDFNGPELRFTGDADASAKIFIDAIASIFVGRLKQERAQALEEAAKVCEAIEREHLETYKHKPGPNAYDPHFQGLSMGAGECAEKIGELLK